MKPLAAHLLRMGDVLVLHRCTNAVMAGPRPISSWCVGQIRSTPTVSTGKVGRKRYFVVYHAVRGCAHGGWLEPEATREEEFIRSSEACWPAWLCLAFPELRDARGWPTPLADEALRLSGGFTFEFDAARRMYYSSDAREFLCP